MNDIFTDLPMLPGFSVDPMCGALPSGVRVYVVGGAVRDALLGLTVTDRDWVVVGADAQQMVAAGFMPVGGDFPVFLHPHTKEEYALARTERKSGMGYKGFVFYAAPDVSLTADLQRRDLTINAMAMDAVGRICDPWGGLADLQARRLRHVSPAFAEDPVRILRLARFAARYSNFNVAPDTLAFCQSMVVAGEARHLVAERIWQELARLLRTATPAAGLQVLRDVGVLGALFENFLLLEQAHLLGFALSSSLVCEVFSDLPTLSQTELGLEQRFALWCLAANLLPDQVKFLSRTWKVPVGCADLAYLGCQWFDGFKLAGTAEMVLQVFTALDLFRRPRRWQALREVWSICLAKRQAQSVLPIAQWDACANALIAFDVGALAKNAQTVGENVATIILDARLKRLYEIL